MLGNLDHDNIDSVKFSCDNMPVEILTEDDFNVRFPPSEVETKAIKQ